MSCVYQLFTHTKECNIYYGRLQILKTSKMYIQTGVESVIRIVWKTDDVPVHPRSTETNIFSDV